MLMMTHFEALEVLARHRGDKIVVTTMTSAGIWPTLSDTPLDFPFLPSSMGQGPSLGLGLALAQSRGVVVVNGDGCTLMNLGCLITIAAHPTNLWLIVMDNGLYEVTGGQPVAGCADFAAIACGCGIPRVITFDGIEEWTRGSSDALSGSGPVVIVLKVEGRIGQKTPKPHRPMSEQISRLRSAIAG